MSDVWAPLAEDYARGRLGYSPELYEAIAQYGLKRGATILDIGCGTGLACEPFAANGFAVTGVDSSPAMLQKAKERVPDASFVEGNAEALPFPNERFDVVVSAQMFHLIDRQKALSEAYRVLRPSGIVAIWWKQLMSTDPLKALRDGTFHAIGQEPPQTGLTGGFKEFYAAPFTAQTLRVIPWRAAIPLDQYMGYERSRRSVKIALGDRAQTFYDELESRMRERYGHGNPSIPLSYVHYLYLAKKP